MRGIGEAPGVLGAAMTECFNEPFACALAIGMGVWGFLQAPTSNFATLFSFTAAIFSGYWVLRDAHRRDKYFPKMEFLVDVLFKAELDDAWLVEIVSTIRNRGIVRFYAAELIFDLRGMRADDTIDETRDEIARQTNFAHPLKEGRWYERFDGTFVEAGTTQIYRHVTTVPKTMAAVLAHGHLVYRDKIKGKAVRQSADRMVRVPADLEDATAYLDGERARNLLSAIAGPVHER